MSVVTGTGRKEMPYGGDDKGIRQELSRNIWTIRFILPIVILNMLRWRECVDKEDICNKKPITDFSRSPTG